MAEAWFEEISHSDKTIADTIEYTFNIEDTEYITNACIRTPVRAKTVGTIECMLTPSEIYKLYEIYFPVRKHSQMKLMMGLDKDSKVYHYPVIFKIHPDEDLIVKQCKLAIDPNVAIFTCPDEYVRYASYRAVYKTYPKTYRITFDKKYTDQLDINPPKLIVPKGRT